jgi:hypothetical protein
VRDHNAVQQHNAIAIKTSAKKYILFIFAPQFFFLVYNTSRNIFNKRSFMTIKCFPFFFLLCFVAKNNNTNTTRKKMTSKVLVRYLFDSATHHHFSHLPPLQQLMFDYFFPEVQLSKENQDIVHDISILWITGKRIGPDRHFPKTYPRRVGWSPEE